MISGLLKKIGFPIRDKKSSRSDVKKVVIALTGLVNAGKTSIVPGLRQKCSAFVKENPSLLVCNGDKLNYVLSSFDLGDEQTRDPSVWSNYLAEAYGIIIVVDSADHAGIPQARHAILDIITDPRFFTKPVAIFANKQDLPTALTMAEVEERLALGEVRCRYIIQGCVALTQEGDPYDEGIGQGLRWIVQQIYDHYESLALKVKRDLAVQAELDKILRLMSRKRVKRLKEERRRALEGEIARMQELQAKSHLLDIAVDRAIRDLKLGKAWRFASEVDPDPYGTSLRSGRVAPHDWRSTQKTAQQQQEEEDEEEEEEVRAARGTGAEEDGQGRGPAWNPPSYSNELRPPSDPVWPLGPLGIPRRPTRRSQYARQRAMIQGSRGGPWGQPPSAPTTGPSEGEGPGGGEQAGEGGLYALEEAENEGATTVGGGAQSVGAEPGTYEEGEEGGEEAREEDGGGGWRDGGEAADRLESEREREARQRIAAERRAHRAEMAASEEELAAVRRQFRALAEDYRAALEGLARHAAPAPPPPASPAPAIAALAERRAAGPHAALALLELEAAAARAELRYLAGLRADLLAWGGEEREAAEAGAMLERQEAHLREVLAGAQAALAAAGSGPGPPAAYAGGHEALL